MSVRLAFPAPTPAGREMSPADLAGRVRRDVQELARLRQYLESRVAFCTHDPLWGALSTLYAVEVSAARAGVQSIIDRLADLVAGAAFQGVRAVEVGDAGLVAIDAEPFQAAGPVDGAPGGEQMAPAGTHDGQHGAHDRLFGGQFEKQANDHHPTPPTAA